MRTALIGLFMMFCLFVHAQNPGQMKVVKPALKATCTAKVIDTIHWQGERYYMLDYYFYEWRDMQGFCPDPNFPNGKFAIYGMYYDSIKDSHYRTTNVSETFEAKNYRNVSQKFFGREGDLQYHIKYNDSCDCTEHILYHGALLYIRVMYKNDSKTEFHFFPNGKIQRQIIYYKDEKSTLDLMLLKSVLEYDLQGNLKYKYNCQNLTRTELYPDGSVKGVTNINNCDSPPSYPDGW